MKNQRALITLILLLLCIPIKTETEEVFIEEKVVLPNDMGKVYGSLLVPNITSETVALIISGSGPTDRDGNQPTLKNNSLKQLAHTLYQSDIASLRYDKRAIAESKIKDFNEADLLFEHYVEDASSWIQWLKESSRFKQIVVIGHSEGSLIGMIAAQRSGADKFISLAGPGKSADRLLKEQLAKQTGVSYFADPLIDDLAQGKQVKPPFFLKTLFRPSVQPYLISWFKYDPSKEIAKLDIDCLVIQGNTDLQVSVKDATLLANSNSKASIIIIDGMNHILKNTSENKKENLGSYNDPSLPLDKELTKQITAFINK